MKGDLQCGVGNAEERKPDVEDDKESLQKCQEMLYHSHYSPQTCGAYCSLISCIHMRKAAYQQCSSSCLQAGWLILPPAHLMYILDRVHGTCERMEHDLIAALFPNQCGKLLLLLDFPPTFQPHNLQSMV